MLFEQRIAMGAGGSLGSGLGSGNEDFLPDLEFLRLQTRIGLKNLIRSDLDVFFLAVSLHDNGERVVFLHYVIVSLVRDVAAGFDMRRRRCWLCGGGVFQGAAEFLQFGPNFFIV